MKFFTSSGIPAVFALLAIAAEFLGSLGLAVGLLTRIAAGEGFEFHLLALGIAITLLIIGGGTWSLDSALVETRISSSSLR